jgi:Tol biopolymer transport system component
MAILDFRPDRLGIWLKMGDKPPRRITDSPTILGPGALYHWSPDSKNFIYAERGGLWTVSVETGKIQRYLWKNQEAIGFDDISPDGRQTVFIKQRMNAKLILIDNFQ